MLSPTPTGGSRPIALGHHRPERVVGNDELAAVVETDDEWIRTRTGIVTRRHAGPDESVPDMAVRAARHALDSGGLDGGAIDLVVVASTTSEHRSPNVAGLVSAALGTPGAAVVDVNVACSGFVHALALADMAIRCGSARRALVVGAEKMTAVTDVTDRSTCVLTADGAGAMVLEAAAAPGVGPVAWGSTPELVQAVRIQPPSNLFGQDGQTVYRWALTHGAAHARRAVELAEVALDDVQVLVTHQANLRISSHSRSSSAWRTASSSPTSWSRATRRPPASRSACSRVVARRTDPDERPRAAVRVRWWLRPCRDGRSHAGHPLSRTPAAPSRTIVS